MPRQGLGATAGAWGSSWNDSEPKEIWRANHHAFDCLRYAKGYTRQTHGQRQVGEDQCKLRP